MKSLLLSLCFLLQISALHAGAAVCPLVKIEAVRLPDLNIPRSGHGFLFVNGQPTVIGGHTSGFVPTSTIEYFSDGQWHVVPTVYPHDAGGSLLLKSGKVLLFGSHEKNLGIGQTFEVEMYNPADHTSEGFGCLDRKRVMPTAVETDSGKVVIAGNWYNDDSIELFEGKSQFTEVKPVSVQRTLPFILPVSGGDVLIFGGSGTHGETITSTLVDRLYGDAYSVPLFEQWHPMLMDVTTLHAEDCFIGDRQRGNMTYLVPVTDRGTGQLAIAQVRDTVFSLLPTEMPVPMETEWGAIYYRTAIVVDRRAKRAYMAGHDKDMRLCILSIEYGKSPSPLTLYYTDPMPHLGLNHLLLTPAGNLLVAGGTNGFDNDNFTPSNQVWFVPMASNRDFHTAATTSWLWWVAALFLIIIVMVVVVAILRHRRKHPVQTVDDVPMQTVDDDAPVEADPEATKLMLRIHQMMVEEKLFLNCELKVSDFVNRLGSNRSYISSCINTIEGCSFSTYVNRYRVEYAKQLLLRQSDKSVQIIGTESGFSSEQSFFRVFKSLTGMTPKEWIQQNLQNPDASN